MSCPNVDGALVGGASLDPAAFASIIRAAALAVTVTLVASPPVEIPRRKTAC